MFLDAKCFCTSTISWTQQGNQDRLRFPSVLKTQMDTNIVKMKEDVTDGVRVQSMIGTCILHKKTQFPHKIFPRREERDICAIFTQKCLCWCNRQAAASVIISLLLYFLVMWKVKILILLIFHSCECKCSFLIGWQQVCVNSYYRTAWSVTLT